MFFVFFCEFYIFVQLDDGKKQVGNVDGSNSQRLLCLFVSFIDGIFFRGIFFIRLCNDQRFEDFVSSFFIEFGFEFVRKQRVLESVIDSDINVMVEVKRGEEDIGGDCNMFLFEYCLQGDLQGNLCEVMFYIKDGFVGDESSF